MWRNRNKLPDTAFPITLHVKEADSPHTLEIPFAGTIICVSVWTQKSLIQRYSCVWWLTEESLDGKVCVLYGLWNWTAEGMGSTEREKRKSMIWKEFISYFHSLTDGAFIFAGIFLPHYSLSLFSICHYMLHWSSHNNILCHSKSRDTRAFSRILSNFHSQHKETGRSERERNHIWVTQLLHKCIGNQRMSLRAAYNTLSLCVSWWEKERQETPSHS